MPELPEVETTLRGIAPHITGRTVRRVIVREPRLRWPVPASLGRELTGRAINRVERRAKYLLLRTDAGTALLHLGMSGSLQLVPATRPCGPHDHVDLVLDNARALRLRDPRRFGSILWTRDEPANHPRLRHLGPEPLDPEAFHVDYLYHRARGRRQNIKAFLMDARTVAGLGNIYVNEALHLAGIRPSTAAGRMSRARYGRLIEAIGQVLEEAIAAGGTTLRDFLGSSGRPGYFLQALRVYGRAGEPCRACGSAVRGARHGQRATYWCPRCQH